MITSSGRNRMATLASSTWTFMKIGTGTATADIADTDLGTSLFIKTIGTISVSANIVFLVGQFTKSDTSSASNITEMAVFDSSTSNHMLFRSVASSNTWTATLKNSTNIMTFSTSLTVSS